MDVSAVSKGFKVTACKKYIRSDFHSQVNQDTKDSGLPPNIEVSAGFDPALLRHVVDQIRSTFNMLDKRLHFRVNVQTNSVVVEVVDSSTNAVIRQIPSEEMQELKKRIERVMGVFVDMKA